MLEIKDLAFTYPDAPSGFLFDIHAAPGEIVGLTGASGSGKSTLLDLVAGFLTPDSGSITLDGQSLLAAPPERRPVSILFQSDNLFEHLTAGANVALGVSSRTRADDPRVIAALEQMNLPGLAKRRASNLSGGQKQRVALARTLLRDRPVLLLDEPFTGLDDETTASIRDTIKTLVKDKGWHAILVSHQADDIQAMANRHYHIADGKSRLL